MSDIQISQVLAQMRALQTRIGGVGVETPQPLEQAHAPDFANLLKHTIDNVATMQNEARSLADSYESGDKSVDISRVMLEVNKASIAFHAMTEVRNKLIDAYTQVMNMSV
jgi:flagellar hook-basal body complex protein FliE